MRKGFSRLLSVPQPKSYDESEEDHDGSGGQKMSEGAGSKMGGVSGMEQKGGDDPMASPGKHLASGGHKERDALKEEVVSRQKCMKSFILTGAKLIAPYIDQREWIAGFDWLIDQLKPDFPHLASEVEIAKAIAYLRRKQFDRAIEVFKSFEKKDAALMAKAATNLSFLYFIEGAFEQADKYANLAVRHDRYNAKALVNKGNCLFANGELEKAKELYVDFFFIGLLYFLKISILFRATNFFYFSYFSYFFLSLVTLNLLVWKQIVLKPFTILVLYLKNLVSWVNPFKLLKNFILLYHLHPKEFIKLLIFMI